MGRKKKKSASWLTIVLIMVASVVLTVVLAVDINNDSGKGLAASLSFDWVETFCSLLSGAASVILGVVAIVESEKSNRLKEELLAVDRMQFENASVSAGLPLIEFRRGFTVRDGVLRLEFADEKGVEVKRMEVWGMHLYPFSKDFRAREAEETVVIQKEGKKKRAVRTSEDNYAVEIKVRADDFRRFGQFCLEFELGVVNEEEVAAVYQFKLLVRGEGLGTLSSSRGRGKSRRKNLRFRVFHQFYEITETMGEEKFEERVEG